MATGRIIIPALAFVPLDGSAGNVPMALDMVQSSGGPPGPRFPRWGCDVVGPKLGCITFRMPADYASAPDFLFDWYTAETTGDVKWMAYLAAITEDDAGSIAAKALDTVNNVIADVLANANRLAQDHVPLANANSVAAGDLVMLVFGRDGAADACEGTAYFLGGIFEYDTSA